MRARVKLIRVRASILPVFTRAEAIALTCEGSAKLDLGGAAAQDVAGVTPAAGRLEDDGAVLRDDVRDLLDRLSTPLTC